VFVTLCNILLDVGGAPYNTKATVEAYKEMDWILGEYSAALSTEATATFMFVPSWNKRTTYVRPQIPYVSLCRKFLHKCKLLGSPSRQLQYEYPSGTNTDALSKHTLELQIVVIWNTKGRNLMPHNNNWLPVSVKELAKDIPGAKWEIKSIHIDSCTYECIMLKNKTLDNTFRNIIK